MFSPIDVRAVTFPNRIGVSPMCMYSAGPDGVATQWHTVHLGSRAVGGAGLVFTEATAVTAEGRITDGDLGIWNDTQREALRPITDFIRQAGAVPGIQLSHAGRKGGRQIPWEGYEPIPQAEWGALPAPSPVAFREGWSTPVEMSAADIESVIESFVSAARRAVQAGFGVIELHFAHGYLLHQFLSPLTNLREDEYGGPLANRARLAVAIAEAVRAEVGPGMPLFARLSVVDWVDGGLTLEESVEISTLLRRAGVDVIDCSSGAVVDGEKVPAGPLYQVEFSSRIRKEAEVLTAAVGLIQDGSDAEGVLTRQDADFILLGRAFLQDAYWPRRAARELIGHEAEPRIPLPYRRAVERMSAPKSTPSQW
ncbi:NADH:flavin oxidoreductase/NADH oxidase [Rhodococcus opacus]|nr:NADH:flavin oxidoreductase/NADH oxidase [Rhodococcus opacus]